MSGPISIRIRSCGRGGATDAGDGRQQTELLIPRRQLLVDLPGVGRDARLKGVVLLQQIVEHEAVVVAQAQGERLAETLQLVRDVAGERGEDDLARRPLRQAVEDLAAVDAEDVGEDAADAHAGAVDDLLHAVAHGGALPDQDAALAAQRAQLPERLGWHMGRRAEPELTHAGQPHAVGHVGLAPLQLLHLTRVHQDRLDPSRLQGREGRLPVNPGPLHDRSLDAVIAQPCDHLIKTAGQCAEAARLHHRLTLALADANRRGDLHLVHIETRRARAHDVHSVRLHRLPPPCALATVEAGTAVGRTRIRRAGAVHFAARPRPRGRVQYGVRSRPPEAV